MGSGLALRGGRGWSGVFFKHPGQVGEGFEGDRECSESTMGEEEGLARDGLGRGGG